MSTPAINSQDLRRRLHMAALRSAKLQGVRKADADSRSRLATEVSEAKARQGLKEEISEIFDALQKRAHERSVGAFERLLSAILRDVLPEEGAVRLIPQFKSNTTWLDVALEKEGKLEDLVEGNGGAVTNVVCAGLRFAALTRTKNRRLMILDEPDCWLMPERVPAFVRVIAQVSEQTRTQTFFITHHQPAYFEGQVNIVRFSADDNGKVFAQALAPVLNQWQNTEDPGLRCIELINFRRHEHTVIPCFPGATAFIGPNNLGKSTAINASFKALGYGESDDSMIRHDCDEARIIFHMEKGRRIEWSRSRKRSPVVLYRLFEEGNPEPIIEGPPKGRQPPDWVVNMLGIQRVDDLDIQLGNQKSPVFLLNETASKRAQILSIGREAGYLKTMMKNYESLKSADQETVKNGEAKIARLDYRLKRLEPLDGVEQTLNDLTVEGDDLFNALERREQMTAVLEKLERSSKAVAQLEKECEILAELPEVPQLVDVTPMQRLIGTIETASRRLNVPELPVLPETPVLADVVTMERLLRTIEVSTRRVNVPELPALPEVPVLKDTASIITTGQLLGKLTRSIAVLEHLPTDMPGVPALADTAGLAALIVRMTQQITSADQAQLELAKAEVEATTALAEYEKTKQDLGGECPLCGSSFPHEEGVAHAHAH